MKRSEINGILREAKSFFQSMGFYLPPFAYWTPAEWASKGDEVREIVQNKLGWDVTDFGLGDYAKNGLLLFTLRNGHPDNWKTGQGKLYAEKAMMVRLDQITPLHFHWQKMEDIINRGGGELVIELYNSTDDDSLAETDVLVSVDGVERVVGAGGRVVLTPGESIALPTRCYHRFWAAGSHVLVGEVSMVNDDELDNRFHKPLPRFPAIEEDEPPLYLLCTEYASYSRLKLGRAAPQGFTGA